MSQTSLHIIAASVVVVPRLHQVCVVVPRIANYHLLTTFGVRKVVSEHLVVSLSCRKSVLHLTHAIRAHVVAHLKVAMRTIIALTSLHSFSSSWPRHFREWVSPETVWIIRALRLLDKLPPFIALTLPLHAIFLRTAYSFDVRIRFSWIRHLRLLEVDLALRNLSKPIVRS